MKNRKRCISCRTGGFILTIGFTKPNFKCTQCDAEWTNGKDGGDEFTSALNVGETVPRDWVTFEWQDKNLVQIREIPDDTKIE